MTVLWHNLATSALLGLFMFGCGGSSTFEERNDRGPPSFEKSPIVFGANDPVGTFFITVEDRNPKYLNDNYYFYPISLSPSRTRVLQVTDDPEGGPDRVVEVFPIEENARLLHRVVVPGGFLGWANDEELVFSTWDSEGFFLLGVDGARRDFRFPDDIVRQMGGFMGSLSPDGSTAAFVVTVQGSADNVLVTFDTQSGRELERWSIPSAQPFWANDGSIVLLANRDIYRIVPGEEVVRGPVALPFAPCQAGPWMDAGTVHVTELVLRGDAGGCENSWVVATDGSSAVRRDAAGPVAISPDGRKILLFDTEGISMADPDGSNAQRFDLFPTVHDFAW